VIFLVAAVLALGAHDTHVVRTHHTWTCKSEVDLDLVRVTIASSGRREDAVHLRKGCTGRIGRLEIVQRSGDGLKVAEGAHDLTVGGGSIRCHAKAPRFHQDGIQVMGGARITFHRLTISCGRQNARLVNSNLFINKAGRSEHPPTDVVCEDCAFGGWAAHTVSVQDSVRSGVTGSTLCVARFPQFTLAVGDDARSPLLSHNEVRQCSPGELTLKQHRHVISFGKPLELRGLFLGQKPGSRVIAEARVYGEKRFARVASTRSRRNGRFKLVLRPRIGQVVRLRSGSILGPVTKVRVRPRILLRRRGATLVAKVHAARSYAGRTVVLQVFRHGHWVGVQNIRLRQHSRARFEPGLHHVRVRIAVASAPGYLPATSEPLRL
jgi:hypothetical protein